MKSVATIVFFVFVSLAARAEDKRAAVLVRQLGDRSFKVREEASRQLQCMGRAAYAALQVGANYPDAEVRERCRQLLPAIFEKEMKARLEDFLNDPDPANDHGLPGWKRYRTLIGSSPADRELFGRMIRADVRLMDSVENRPAELGAEHLAGRCSLIQMQLQSRDLAIRDSVQFSDVAQLLFLGSHADMKLTPVPTQFINSLTYQPQLRQGLKSGDHVAAAKTLLLAWFEHNASDAGTCNAAANMLIQTGMKELLAPILRAACNPKLMQYARAQAIVAIGRAGSKDQIAPLETLLTDNTQVARFNWNNIRGQTRICDIALATAIHLSGQKPGDFGFEAVKNNPGFIHSYHYLGFENDETRAAAQKKWEKWKIDNQKPGK